MKRNRRSKWLLLLSAGMLAQGLAGCETLPRGEDSPWFGPDGQEAMAKGSPCYFRGEVDFCRDMGEPDSDGDGVKDRRDQCPGTPRGLKVDEYGCPLDSDGDGVLDDKDQCPNTPTGARVNEVGCWVLENLPFHFDKSTLAPESFPLLDDVVMVLRNNAQVRVEIQGHTDPLGTPEYNEKLSKRRAVTVMRYLIDHGIAANRLMAAGFGLTKPVADNDTEAGRAKNRRVELKPLF